MRLRRKRIVDKESDVALEQVKEYIGNMNQL
jgi:hypothetical protein